MKKKVMGVALAVFVPVALLILIYMIVGFFYKNHFFPGTWINGINCSNKSVSEVMEDLEEYRSSYTLRLLERGRKQEFLSSEDIGYMATYESVGDIKTQQNNWLWPLNMTDINFYTAQSRPGFEEEKLKKAIEGLQCVSGPDVSAPQDAYIDYTDGIHIIPEVEGNTVDVEKLFNRVSEAILSGEYRLNLEEADCYMHPEVTMDSREFQEMTAPIRKYTDVKITLTIHDDVKEVIDGSVISSWLYKDDEDRICVDGELVRTYMKAMEDKYDTLYKEKSFTNSYGETISVKPGTLGWSIAANNETKRIMDELEAGEDVERDIEFDAKAVGWDDEIGDTYVEVSIDHQYLWYYVNGEVLVETPITSGTKSTGHDTPRGAFYINNKQMHVTLIGADPEDPYESEVTYWLPFKGNTYGLHDASWRGSYGGSVYIYNGSHGCINTPYYKVQAIYENITKGTPVIVW